ncbi:MAG: CoA-binding protein, partial [Alphaproteobacteria bacterium]|nr:CoA-binding protein [Alphaproteobacteria bacterium]
MSIRNLEKMFKPQAVAVIGASNRAHSVGRVVMHNLLGEEFTGPIMPVNPKYDAVAGVLAFDSIPELPHVPDLAVICTPPQTVPEIISQLGERGCKSAVVITAAVDEEAMLKAARPHMMRLLGPNCVGLLVPGQHLNASFAPSSLPAGKIAFASQSGALCTAVLDWAAARDIGFSHFISMGNCADVDFGDVIDYLARDPETESILLYIESVKHPRKFLSAARAASRAKPIIAIKSGRNEVGAHAAASHTGALAGGDDVYDAAFARAGILRVDTTEDLFNAVETLAHVRPLEGEKLCIITNGGGAGVMAADLLGMEGGEMAELSEQTIEALDEVLPANWSRANPVDIIGDAPAERYVKALEILSRAEELDALLVMHAPVAVTSAEDLARGVVPILREMDKPVLTNWLGEKLARPAREVLS